MLAVIMMMVDHEFFDCHGYQTNTHTHVSGKDSGQFQKKKFLRSINPTKSNRIKVHQVQSSFLTQKTYEKNLQSSHFRFMECSGFSP